MDGWLAGIRRSLGVRMAVVGFLALVLLVPLAMVRDVIHDRQRHRAAAVASVAAGHAGAQQVAGPVLVVPWEETRAVESIGADGDRRVTQRRRSGTWLYFPESSELLGTLRPDTRRRGLHEVRVYELDATLSARFAVDIPAAPEAGTRTIGQPWLAYGLSDVRGLAGTPVLRVSGATVPLLQGMGAFERRGIHARLQAPAAGRPLRFDATLGFALGGTESLAIAPVADHARVVIDSTWPHPRFEGGFLPRARRVSADGFHADWEVSSLASSAQSQFEGEMEADGPEGAGGPSRAPGLDTLGISLVDPVNPYVLADRASKYGALFVLLTFGGFFLFETLRRLPIHPIQYVLVGLALALFFLLLLALSEHFAFGASYLAASAACIGLLAYYLAHVLRSARRGVGVAAALALLYAALYGLLVSEDNALVLGAGLLFAVLAATMVATRRVDWYALGRG
jgi:inner membrane protein